jgi:hypothetical protein
MMTVGRKFKLNTWVKRQVCYTDRLISIIQRYPRTNRPLGLEPWTVAMRRLIVQEDGRSVMIAQQMNHEPRA